MTSSPTSIWYHHPLPGNWDYQWDDAQKWWWWWLAGITDDDVILLTCFKKKKTTTQKKNKEIHHFWFAWWRWCHCVSDCNTWISSGPTGINAYPSDDKDHKRRPHTVFWQSSCPAAVLKARCQSQASREFLFTLHEKLLPNSRTLWNHTAGQRTLWEGEDRGMMVVAEYIQEEWRQNIFLVISWFWRGLSWMFLALMFGSQ